jgi:hypothetical protein
MKKPSLVLLVVPVLVFLSLSGFSQNSVLSSGNWYKLSTSQYGVYKIGYDDLVSYGIDPSAINPKNIKIYGNGNGMLPEENSEFRYDDLQENAIFVAGEDDGSFDQEDYILFYGEGPTVWSFNNETSLFEHQINYYSDYTYYFLTTNPGEGKRIETEEQSSQPATFTKTTGDDFILHEEETVNLLKTGKEWYGEELTGNSSVDFAVSLPGADLSSSVTMIINVAARTFEDGLLRIYVDGEVQKEITIPSVNAGSTLYGKEKTDTLTFVPSSADFNIELEYISSDTTTLWLNYFTINYKRNLTFQDGAFLFRCADVAGAGNVTQFQISDVTAETDIWNVSDPLNVRKVDFDLSGNTLSFKTGTENIKEFIAFDNSEVITPSFVEQVPNQNLHSLEPPDIIVISYDDFTDEAQQLADFHQENDGLTSVIATPGKIYNEFSSGAQDVTAIRDFVKYLYDKAGSGNKPSYLLLIGRASYDYKDRIENNTNLVPVMETENSLNNVAAFGSDDFYGWLDNNEGTEGIVDIGIGRIPALTNTEVQNYIEKVFHYSTSEATLGNWKNEICFVADDGDNNIHLLQADSLTLLIPMNNNPFNITKTYLDFFELVQTSGGPRYPEVNQSIDSQIGTGRFLVNYTGHGGDDTWAQELVLTKEQIENWTNFDKLPVFIVAACSFSGFDNPEITKGGVLLTLNADGGAIGVFSPVQISFSQMNFSFNKNYIKFFANKEENRTLGNMQRYAKEAIGNNYTGRNWNLLGDPALVISFPEYQIATETVNGIPVTEPLDTIHPGDQLDITGLIIDSGGNQLTGFNGALFIKVFYKNFIRTTNGNQSPTVDISVQDSVMLETAATVTNGEFEVQFAIPENLDQEYGNLRLSYYATDGVTDASGYFTGLLAGGEPNGISEFDKEGMFNVYPTYATDYVSIVTKENNNNVRVTIYDLTGKPVVNIDNTVFTKEQEIKINVSGLTKGLYILQIMTEKGISSYKIIKS